jgi:hypothetical protein
MMLGMWMAMAAPCSAEPVAAGGPGATVQLRSHSSTAFPAGATESSARCVIRAEIDERGRATETAAFGCPRPFADVGAASVRRWRWYPPTVDGEPARGRALVTVVWFRDREEILPPPTQCDHQLTVAGDGTLTPAPADPAVACAAVFPDQVEPPPVPLSCAIDVDKRDGERSLSLERCPAEAWPWIEGLVEHATLSPAGWTTLWIDARL